MSRQRVLSVIMAVATLTGGSIRVFADEPSPVPATSIDQKIEQLDQEIRILKRQREIDREEAEKKAKETPILVAGKDGFALKSADGKFEVRLRGVLQADAGFFVNDTAKLGTDTFQITKARPIIEGTVFNNFDFRFMPDFGRSQTVLFDAYLEWKYWPWLKVRGGKFRPPIGLEQLQQDHVTKFVQRGLPTQLVPNRDVGLQLGGDLFEGTVTYAVGIFNGVADNGNGDIDGNDDKDIEGRIFILPFKNTDIGPLKGLGVGIAASTGESNGTTNSPALPSYKGDGQLTFFKYRNDGTTAGTVVASGDQRRLSPQAYYYRGPLGLIGEYVISEQNVLLNGTGATLRNTAWQVAASLLLTGEEASYGSVVPRRPFNLKDGGWGAWELVGRYGELDADNDAFTTFASATSSATKASAWDAGVNWYLNKNVRVAVNYGQTTFVGGSATGNRADEQIAWTRLQLAY